ncbi:hypothetical protein N0O92_13780 [Alkalihalobacillus sp. MEB130]|uniref:glycine betaine ABC transporter substrate-binding protein n=1 Tax=Alkalihalobacillus sp. MEB130 TaxID=2976704 RepID=UPI0028DEE412|nr:glycine betaine ABC transporter substrate-binding protein [Alkalihalobacillus sp. MEB130]MDT8861304.1 hypothetical protein [Alkalihalobacillus sp. MEB130]
MATQSIEELLDAKEVFKGKVIGIEPGAGLMRITREEAIPGYGLNDWELVESSTPGMVAELEKAVSTKNPIVVTLWSPHWAFEEFNLRYLEDPKGLMNPNGVEELQSIGRLGFANEYPEVTEWLSKFSITSEQLALLEAEIIKAENEVEGVENWLVDHKSVTDEWFR